MHQVKTVKLTKTSSRKIGSKTYHKFIITIPLEHVNELGWTEKTDLKMKNDGKRLIIEKE